MDKFLMGVLGAGVTIVTFWAVNELSVPAFEAQELRHRRLHDEREERRREMLVSAEQKRRKNRPARSTHRRWETKNDEIVIDFPAREKC
jgi:hypothetical protein